MRIARNVCCDEMATVTGTPGAMKREPEGRFDEDALIVDSICPRHDPEDKSIRIMRRSSVIGKRTTKIRKDGFMYLSKYNTGHRDQNRDKAGACSFPRAIIRASSSNLPLVRKMQKQRKALSKSIDQTNIHRGVATGKRIDLTTMRGSVTVEAALVLPIVIFAFLSFFYFFVQIRFEMVMQESFADTGVTGALVYGMEERGEAALDEFAGTEITELMSGDGANLLRGMVLSSYIYANSSDEFLPFLKTGIGGGGIKSFSLLSSAYDSDSSEGTMSVSYKFTLPWIGKAFSGQTSTQSGYFRSWTGRSMKDEVVYVYMTPNGSVYHLTLDCTYLTKRIQSVSLETAKASKNSYGISYTACSLCCDEDSQKSGTVYITAYGTKYHADISCTSITHDIRKLTLEEAQESYPLCSKCAKESSANGE